jgi:drug/metabolite transporter (DMT)-like permease
MGYYALMPHLYAHGLEAWMEYALLVMTMFIFATQTVAFKEFNRRYMINLASYYLFNTFYFTIVVLICLAVSRTLTQPSMTTIVLGFVHGALFILTMLLYMKSMEQGPLSYASLIFSLGLLVPVIFSAIIWKESISLPQIAGLLLLFVTLAMGSRPVDHADVSKNRIRARWLIIAVLSMLCNGSLMTISKAQQMLQPGKEISEYLIISFGTSAVLSLVLFMDRRLRRNEPNRHMWRWMLLFLVLLAGIVTAFGNEINVYLAGRIPAIVQFPTVNGGQTILSALFAMVIYKERLGQGKAIGLATGLGAIALLSIR